MKNKKLGVDIKINGANEWLTPDSGGIVLAGTGDMAVVDDIALVDQALKLRLNTRKGELWAHPSYGNPVFDILSDLMSEDWLANAVNGLTDCINDEPRAECLGVSYKAVPQERRVEFTVQYRVIDGREKSLVWNYASEEAIGNV